MPEYLLELYVPRAAGNPCTDDARSVRAAAEELTRRGTPVSCGRSIFVPAEETWFVLLEAESAEVVRGVARLAHVSGERINAAFSDPATVVPSGPAPTAAKE